MIPYFRITSFPLGPVHIQVWGLMVATGMIAAIALGCRESKKRGLDPDAFFDFASWIMAFALIGARLFHAFAYAPAIYLANPIRLLYVWEGGMSSVGGFLGAVFGAWLFIRRRKVSFKAYSDVACYALPLGYGIGRIGCFLIHDHPGTLSHSLLAVNYPNGSRLDHGLLLSIVGFTMFGAFWLINRQKGKGISAEKGFLPLFMISYGVIRFILDFYRATDVPGSDIRYAGLTPAQYATAAMAIAGVVLLMKYRRSAKATMPVPPSSPK